MHVLQETKGSSGWYHECPEDSCRKTHATSGKSTAPGWTSKSRVSQCPLCGHKSLLRVSVDRPHEYRVLRQGDGLVMERFPATDNGLEKANTLLASLT